MTQRDDADLPRPGPTWALLRSGGKQFVVRLGDKLSIPRSDYLAVMPRGADGRRLAALDDVLALDSGGVTVVGTPTVPDARIVVELLPEQRGPKVVTFHKRRRQNSRRKRGSRQTLQPVIVVSIEDGSGPSLSALAWQGLSPAAGPAHGFDDETREAMRTLWGGVEGDVVGSLRRVAMARWDDVPASERRAYAKALEPWLSSGDVHTRAGSALALTAMETGQVSHDTPMERVATALEGYFAETKRRHFAEVVLRTVRVGGEADGSNAGGGTQRQFQATVTLRDRLRLPSGAGTVRLRGIALEADRVQVTVTGAGVDPRSTRVIERRDAPPGTLSEIVVDFTGDTRISDQAVLDVVAAGRRIERRFLNLTTAATARTPPGGRTAHAPPVPGTSSTATSGAPDHGSASSA